MSKIKLALILSSKKGKKEKDKFEEKRKKGTFGKERMIS